MVQRDDHVRGHTIVRRKAAYSLDAIPTGLQKTAALLCLLLAGLELLGLGLAFTHPSQSALFHYFFGADPNLQSREQYVTPLVAVIGILGIRFTSGKVGLVACAILYVLTYMAACARAA